MATSETPRLVIYYNNNTTPLKNIINMDYTHVILSFLIPDPNNPLNLVLSGNLDSSVLGDIKPVQQAGKKVMIAMGGETFSSQAYQAMVGKEDQVAAIITAIVNQYGFDGVDLDYEDTAAIMSKTPYDGPQFISDLTNALAGKLPSGAILTHAPQPPYLCAPKAPFNCSSSTTGYVEVLQKAGSNISWLNMQYYNNEWYVTPVDKIVTGYEQAVAGWSGFTGISASKLLAGKPVGQNDAGSGWIPVDDIVSEIVKPLLEKHPDFGGVMGWQYSSDPDGTWAKTLSSAMGL